MTIKIKQGLVHLIVSENGKELPIKDLYKKIASDKSFAEEVFVESVHCLQDRNVDNVFNRSKEKLNNLAKDAFDSVGKEKQKEIINHIDKDTLPDLYNKCSSVTIINKIAQGLRNIVGGKVTSSVAPSTNKSRNEGRGI